MKDFIQYKKRKEAVYAAHLGSPIKPLFDEEGAFNPRNWNCGSAVGFRTFAFDELEENQAAEKQFVFADEDTPEMAMVTRDLYFLEDTWYSIILMTSRIGNRQQTTAITTRIYKHRGNIEEILRDGQPITQKEFVKMLDFIEKTGYPIWQ